MGQIDDRHLPGSRRRVDCAIEGRAERLRPYTPGVARFILKRSRLLPLLLVVFPVTVFAIVQAPPGDFLTTYVATLASSGSSITIEQVAALRREYGLDQPVWVQYRLSSPPGRLPLLLGPPGRAATEDY